MLVKINTGIHGWWAHRGFWLHKSRGIGITSGSAQAIEKTIWSASLTELSAHGCMVDCRHGEAMRALSSFARWPTRMPRSDESEAKIGLEKCVDRGITKQKQAFRNTSIGWN